ncbi:hypothetical protein SAMN05878482_101952 [Peribacillus simplex]|uniref:Uncharacterized protein n=1 Tax=Peribacillus simplex TaxID=1478 RepID=A0A9X8R4C7_9BACI|nr:hypothetical protein SAMN05878482_101952 [Peribacillus simplex]
MMSGKAVPRDSLSFSKRHRDEKDHVGVKESRHLLARFVWLILRKEAGSFFNRSVFIVYNGGKERHREACNHVY